MKKIFALCMAAVIMLFLAACRGNSPYASAQVGDVIQFGGVDWRVLDTQDGKALILSDNLLSRQQYHTTGTAVTWKNCSLRKYLNGSFCDDTFTKEEKKRIAKTKISNMDNQWFGTDGGSDTTDKVFLLSIEEMVRYFGDSGQLANRPTDTWWIDDEYNSARIAADKDTGAASWWWLRSPGFDSRYAACVLAPGILSVDGGIGLVSADSAGVRPALWLNL